jgi:hypothetical protein
MSRSTVDNKNEVQYFKNEDYKSATEEYNKLLKSGKGKLAVALATADHQIIRWNYPDIKTGFRRYWQTNYQMFGEYMQETLGQCKSMVLSSRSIGYQSQDEYARDQRRVKAYKDAYYKRMIAHAKLIEAERLRGLKSKTVRGYHRFTISMGYNLHNRVRMEDYPLAHNDAYLNNFNNLDYVLAKYSHWVKYRTNWFMRDKNQRIGPEFMLSGKNQLLWTTASSKSKDPRLATHKQIITGHLHFTRRLSFEKEANHILIEGRLNGDIKVTKCKQYSEC